MNKLFFQTILKATVIGTITLTANTAQADLIPKPEKINLHENLVALQFELPDDSVPQTRIGGGVRGKVQFALPEEASTPNSSIGGGIRGEVQFALPEEASTPNSSVGGGVRGEVQFTLPEEASTPNSSVGGGVRGEVQFTLPEQAATPNNSVGGGIRGKQIPLTALLPSTKHGRTVSARPTIFAYLPPIGTEEVFFSIQDEAGNSHYQTMLEVPNQEGVISVTLTDSIPELELGKNYLWYFAPIEPGGILKPDNYAVMGWVTRVEADINQQEFASSAIELATEYASSGIWYDTLEVLVKAQQSDPDNTTFFNEWHDLLEQLELEEIASKPIAIVKLF